MMTPLPVADNGAELFQTSLARTIVAELSFVTEQLFPASILWIEGYEKLNVGGFDQGGNGGLSPRPPP